MNLISNNDSLICYSDIIGFSPIICGSTDVEITKTLELLEKISMFFENIKFINAERRTVEDRINKELTRYLSFDIFNDSLLIIGSLPKSSLAMRR